MIYVNMIKVKKKCPVEKYTSLGAVQIHYYTTEGGWGILIKANLKESLIKKVKIEGGGKK